MQDFNQLLRDPEFQGLFSNNCRHLLNTFDHISVLNTEDSLDAIHKIHSGLNKAQWSWFNKMVGHRKDADFTFEAAIGRLQKDPDGTKTRTGKAFQLLKKYNGELKSVGLLKEVYQYGKDKQWGKKGKKKDVPWKSTELFFAHANDKPGSRTAAIAKALDIQPS